MIILNPYRFGGTPGFVRSQVDATNKTTYTFTGSQLPVGRIAVAAFVNALNININSVTIGGVTATARNSFAAHANFEHEIWDAVVTPGNNGEVVVVADVTSGRCSIGVWSVYGLDYQTGATDYQASSTTATLDVNTTAADFVICASFNRGTQSTTPTGYTEDYDELTETSNDYHAGGHNSSATGGTPETFTATIGSATQTGGVSAVYR